MIFAGVLKRAIITRHHAVKCIHHSLVSTLTKVCGGSGGKSSMRYIIAVNMEVELIPSAARPLDICTRGSCDENALTRLLIIRSSSGSDIHTGAIDACSVSAARLPSEALVMTVAVNFPFESVVPNKLIDRFSIRAGTNILIAASLSSFVAALPEIMPARIGVPKRIVSCVRIFVQRLGSSRYGRRSHRAT